jgi:uncharacterized membrane protein YgcG
MIYLLMIMLIVAGAGVAVIEHLAKKAARRAEAARAADRSPLDPVRPRSTAVPEVRAPFRPMPPRSHSIPTRRPHYSEMRDSASSSPSTPSPDPFLAAVEAAVIADGFDTSSGFDSSPSSDSGSSSSDSFSGGGGDFGGGGSSDSW